MKAHTASLLNAFLLIALSSWGYFTSNSPSATALIPAFIGVVLLLLNRGIQKENKIIAHVAVLLTLLILFGLIKPLMGSLNRGNYMAVARVALMLVSTLVALVFFVRSFIEARKNRAA